MSLESLGPGDGVGPYRIVQPLGEGGMGRVLLAHDERLGRHVALKVLSGALREDPVARERLVREARAVSRISHPNVAALYDIGEKDGDVFLAMEYVEGESLSRRIDRGPLPIADLVSIGAQVAAALDAAHRQGVVHRDVKPGNVLIKPDGTVKVVDFGLAMRTELPPGSLPSEPSDGPESRITRTGYTAGTISYMSPEQARGEMAEFRSDLFSLGVVLYECATGMLPFVRTSPLATAAAILRDDPRPLRSLRTDAPAAFAEVVHRCLEKKPEDRPASAAAVADALRLLDAGHSSRTIRRALGGSRPLWPSLTAAVGVTAVAALIAIRFLVPANDAEKIRDVEARKRWEQSVMYDQRGTTVVNLQHAVTLARGALEREPDNPLLQAHLAYQLARLQLEDSDPAHTEEIESLAVQALGRDPELAEAWFARAWRLQFVEDFQGSLEAARKGKKLAPEQWNGFAIGGRALIRLGKTEEGLAELRRGLEAEGGAIFTRAVLGYELYKLGKTDEAVAEFRKVLELAPDHPSALNNLGAIYLMNSRHLDAIPILQRLLAEQPSGDAASNLGSAYYFVGRMPEAIRHYERAIELDPTDPEHKRNLADAYERVGRPEEARKRYEEGLADCDRRAADGTADAKTRTLRALLLAKTGRTSEALAAAHALDEAFPRDIEVQFAVAQIHALAGERKGTFDHVKIAVALGYPRDHFRSDPYFGELRNDPEFLDLLGQ